MEPRMVSPERYLLVVVDDVDVDVDVGSISSSGRCRMRIKGG
jgi:hypothetical protein